MALKTHLKYLPKQVRLPCQFYSRLIRNQLDREIFYLRDLCSSRQRAIDIGANCGIYSFFLANHFEIVEAFEPQSYCAQSILDYAQFKPNLRVHSVALSDVEDSLPLRIPYLDNREIISELARLSHPFDSLAYKTIVVPVRELDSYAFENVSLIKIDVEGHESQAISGGRETILKCQPLLLVEIEKRHLVNLPIEAVFNQVQELGYTGYFLQNGHRTSLSEFSCERHQEPFLEKSNPLGLRTEFQGCYINNFIFEPK